MKAGRGYRYGYPVIGGKHVLIHRYTWEQTHKRKVPKGWVVRHKCDVTLCINPKHLVIGTQRDNAMDAVKRGRHGNSIKSAISCRAGHPRTDENVNLYVRPDGKWERVCRICKAERAKKYRVVTKA
jgi:HNH endonuclease